MRRRPHKNGQDCFRPLARYDAGPIECPDCHALQSRRLTQVDFLIDLGVMLSLLLALVLLLPVFVGIRTELRSFLNLLFLGSGILFLDQFRFLLYRVSPTTSNRHRNNAM
ncbi:hypothetical protein [Holdemania sp. Marseille-P2844]|uniref:hypothetical protein n=1 Tax=Holdemania sp. Marseille-P2844 TaxID=1852366 RepID=UPI0009323951|nr:hypothetical protein [Holdemania sp. Marseille-P2844]